MPTPSLVNIPFITAPNVLFSQIPESGAGDFTVTRATTPDAGRSTRVNAAGLVELVPDNIARLDYPLGGAVNGCPALLVEPAATNGIRNNSMVGAVAGSPGTLPTNWALSSAGLTSTIIATGSESGVQFIDIRLNGNATGTLALIEHDSNTQIVASNGQAWTYSVYAKVVSAPAPAGAYRINIREFTSGGGTLAEGTTDYTPTSSLARYSATRTLSGGPTVARVAGRLYFILAIGSAYDFTIRIGYPQMEQSSVATSVIPTTTAAVTRSGDNVEKTGVSSLIGQTEGTLYIECENVSALNDVFYLNKDTTNTVRITKDASNIFTGTIRASGVSTSFVGSSGVTGIVKIAIAYKSGDSAMYLNGIQIGTTSSNAITFSAALSKVTLSDSAFFVGKSPTRILATAIYPTRLSNVDLVNITAPAGSFWWGINMPTKLWGTATNEIWG